MAKPSIAGSRSEPGGRGRVLILTCLNFTWFQAPAPHPAAVALMAIKHLLPMVRAGCSNTCRPRRSREREPRPVKKGDRKPRA